MNYNKRTRHIRLLDILVQLGAEKEPVWISDLKQKYNRDYNDSITPREVKKILLNELADNTTLTDGYKVCLISRNLQTSLPSLNIYQKYELEEVSRIVGNENIEVFIDTYGSVRYTKDEFLIYLSQIDKLIKAIPIRLANVLMNLMGKDRINSIDLFEVLYLKSIDFSELRNVGKKTSRDLAELKEKIDRILIDDNESVISNSIYQKDKSLRLNRVEDWANLCRIILSDKVTNNLLKIDVLNSVEQLSIRSTNCLNGYLNESSFNLENFLDKLVLTKPDFGQLPSSGNKTVNELNNFRESILKLMTYYSSNSFSKVDLLIKILKERSGVTDLANTTIEGDLKSQSIDLIYYFDFFLTQTDKLKITEKAIIQELFTSYKGIDRSKLAQEFKISAERVRQISLKVGEKLSLEFKFLARLLPYSKELHRNLSADYWNIEVQQSIGSRNLKMLQYSNYCFSCILNAISLDTHFILNQGLKLKTLLPFNRNFYESKRRLSICLIVNRSFIDKEVVLNIFEEVFRIQSGKVEEDFEYCLDNYSLNPEQVSFTKQILKKQFNAVTTRNGILIKRNTLITLEEVIIETLKSFDKPLTVDEILGSDIFKSFGKDSNSNSVRSILQRTKFITLRGSTTTGTSRYGLKEWAETKNLLEGSIKALSRKYLESHNKPIHIHELGNFIKKHRETTESNLLSNLKLDEKSVFKFYPGGFIGLNSKNYNPEELKSIKNITPHDAIKILSFLRDHRYYNYQQLIRKFNNDLGLQRVQIEYLINGKVDEEILSIKEEKIYFESLDEDLLIQKIFDIRLFDNSVGFNPYRIRLNDKKFIIKICTSDDIEELPINTHKFSSYDRTTNDILAFIIKSDNSDYYYFGSWTDDLSQSQLISNWKEFYQNSHSQSTKFGNNWFLAHIENQNIAQLKSYINSLTFQEEITELKYLEKINIDGLSKMDSFSKIMDVAESKYNIHLDFTQVKTVYQLISSNNK